MAKLKRECERLKRSLSSSSQAHMEIDSIIDGIDFTGIALGASTFDIKQIEILRGPQGTLYGANALAGLINIVGNNPTEDFYSEVSGSISEFGGSDIGVIISDTNDKNFGYRLGLKNSKKLY